MTQPATLHLDKERSWWHGTVTTWCGITVNSSDFQPAGWLQDTTKCPACKAAQKAGRR